jgi:cell wall-associated NlpC family hydrolase
MATPTAAAARTSPRRAPARVTLAVAGVLGILLSAVPAQAAPGAPTTTAEAAELVAARAHDLEVISEDFNEARETLAAQTAAAQAAVDTLEKTKADLAAAQQHVRGIARAAYTGEGVSSFRALMTSDNADDFVDRVATLQTIAGHQNGILGDAATASVAASQAQVVAVKAADEAQAQYDDVAAQQADLEAQIAEYKATFDRLSAQDQAAALAASSHEDRASRADRPAEEPLDSGPIVADSQAAQIAVDTAMAQRGKPYVWAADGPNSFDCSGLVMYAYAAAGIDLPHSSRMQASIGRSVSRDELRPGDLVAFYSPISHIGIYIGNGQMVHAPSTGDVVKVSSIDRVGGIAAMTRIAG